MAVLRVTEAELVRDIIAVLAKVRQGSEIVIEQGNRAVAVINPSEPVAE
jgi:antitoxin (DNA-binding transcriptional repressor) of toxin-antitoxin stability system